MAKLISIILAGGKGERLWPQSNATTPKQFATITSDKSMLAETLHRSRLCSQDEDIYISIMNDSLSILKKTLPDFPKKNLIQEPMVKDTACALLLATLSVHSDDNDVLIFIPADHYVNKLSKYKQNILKAFQITKKTNQATLIGIPASFPSTEYGYLKTKSISKSTSHSIVESFIEKPNLNKAKQYLKDKNYLWNSGIFMFNKKFLLEKFKEHTPDLYKKVIEYLKLKKNPKTKKKALEIFSKIEKISFDFAIAEKLKYLDCVKSDFLWNDIGNWEAFFRIKKSDKHGNLLLSKNFFAKDSTNNLCMIEDGKNIVLNGIKDLIIICKNNQIYISHRESAHKIKTILKEIENEKK